MKMAMFLKRHLSNLLVLELLKATRTFLKLKSVQKRKNKTIMVYYMEFNLYSVLKKQEMESTKNIKHRNYILTNNDSTLPVQIL